jgi:hypothetical protein
MRLLCRTHYLTLDIRGINDIRLNSRPIHAPSYELEDTGSNIYSTKVVSKRILVELLGIREESIKIYLWGKNPLTYFRLLFYIETCLLHLGVWWTLYIYIYIYIYMMGGKQRQTTPKNLPRMQCTRDIPVT